MSMRVGVAGLIHGHVWGLIKSWEGVPEATLASVSDRTGLLDKIRGKFMDSYASWEEQIEKSALDILTVTSDNLESEKIAIAALERGIHVLMEKPMATTYAGAQRILEAQAKGKAKLMINWPFWWQASLQDWKKSIDSGAIGRPFYMKYRNGHSGPKEIGCEKEFVEWLYDEDRNGGGSISDFGSYGAALSEWIFGDPTDVFAIARNLTKEYPICDDHSVIVLKYEKAEVTLEGTWATNGFDRSANPVIHGTSGTLGIFGNEVELSRSFSHFEKKSAPALPETNPAQYFMNCIKNNSEPEGMLNPKLAAKACRIIDAARQSAKLGQVVKY